MFGRATIRLGIGPHSSCVTFACSKKVHFNWKGKVHSQPLMTTFCDDCECLTGVGALFDNADDELRSAYNYEEMIIQNKRAARFRLRSETNVIDNDDSYAVGATSKLCSPCIDNAVKETASLSSVCS